MYFNSLFRDITAEIPATPRQVLPPLPPVAVAAPEGSPQICVLMSRDHPVNKRFYVDETGRVQKDNFQSAFLYDAHTISVDGIRGLSQLIEHYSVDDRYLLIRGLPKSTLAESIRRSVEGFAEHLEGTPWVMLDFDNIPLPDNINPLSREAIEWVVTKLPAAFHDVSYFYQYSASAGILGEDGQPLKSGLNVHLFFWLDRRVPGKDMTACLSLHCMETSFYKLGPNRGEVVTLVLGIDPAPIRSEVQAHFIAAPTIESGVTCLLTSENRQGLVLKSSDSVPLPRLPEDIIEQERRLRVQLVDEYKRTHGYVTRKLYTQISGKTAVTRYSVPPSGAQAVRGGRVLDKTRLSADGRFLTLYFEGEGSPGSWYVRRDRPQLGYRHGDGAVLALKELSAGAHAHVRDELRWFSEIPHEHCELENGYLPPLASFATAKVSLILAPTGSGKTRAAIQWTRTQRETYPFVLYAAPTIALVNQMAEDLRTAEIQFYLYGNVWGPSFPAEGVVLSTNHSLPRLLNEIYDRGQGHVVIFDEIHQGLDYFMSRTSNLRNFEETLSKSRQTLLLTGTLTDVQRHAVVETTKHALVSLQPNDYCCYEFQSVRQYPLQVLPTKHFDSEFGRLLCDFQEKLGAGQPLPRFVLLLDTSRMWMYNRLIEAHGLNDYAMIVSRQENIPEEIEAARVSDRPILISSPLFALGLNFAYAPEILWVLYGKVEADTSQIIQAVNRANRGGTRCEVRIYGNPSPDADFQLPNAAKLGSEITEQLQGEATLRGVLEQHFQIDRVTYNVLREAERNSATALSILVRDNAIQNFTLVEPENLPEIDKGAAEVLKTARKAAREDYRNDIAERSQAQPGNTLHGLVRLDQLRQEQRINWRTGESRTARDLDHDEAAIVMAMLGIDDPTAAQKVSVKKLRRLFGEDLPWLSDQFHHERFVGWAKIAAEKTERILVLLEKLKALREGQLTAKVFAASLSRNKQLVAAFQALASNEEEFLRVGQKLSSLKKKFSQLRQRGGKKEREAVLKEGLRLLKELLEPLGVTYAKKESRGRLVTDLTQPIVPRTWDFSELVFSLQRQIAWLKALPEEQRVPALAAHERVDETMTEDLFQNWSDATCDRCVFFRQRSCVQGIPVDWQSGQADVEESVCRCFKAIKPELMLH